MSSTMKRKGLRLLAMVLAMVMVIGLVPVSAAKKKSVTVSTKTELFAAMQKSDVGTITYKTDKSGKLTISAKAGSETKKLVIDAPNKKITNKASFSSVVIKNAKSYTEKVSGNKIYASSKKLALSIASKKKATLVCNKKSASVTLTAGKKTTVDVTLSKKTNLTVKGNKTAKVTITSKAKNSKVTASIPVMLEAAKNMSAVLEKGSENTVINARSEKVKVKVTNKSGKEPTMKVAGKNVAEPTKAPVTPAPTASPTPTSTPVTGSGDVIIGYVPSGGSSSGGGYSGGGYSGGGSSSGGSSTVTPTPANQYTVSNQTELEAKLAELSSADKEYTIILKTDEASNIEIAEGKYTGIALVVDAPNASVANKATFKKVELKNISASTWTEQGADNTIVSYVPVTHIVIGIGSVNTVIEIENGVKDVIIENNGSGQSISGVYLNTGANVTMSGSNHTGYFVNNQAENTSITTSVQITLRTKYNVDVQVLAGGETSDVVLMADGVKVSVTGLGIITVSDYVSGTTYDITAEKLADTALIESQGKGKVSGKVLFSDETPAENVTIKAYYYKNSLDEAVAETAVAEIVTDEEGYFEIDTLDLSNYYLVYSLEGYKTVYRVLCLVNDNVSVDETILASTASTAGSIRGTLIDAKTGKAIETAGITIKLRAGLGNVSGDVLKSTATDNAGNYSFDNIDAGSYTIQVVDDRRNPDGMYVRTDRNVYVAGDGVEEVLNITVNYQVVNSTEIVVGGEGELRFVLEWYGQKTTGSVPADLDSHLIGPTSDLEGTFHIYCNDKLYALDETVYADLDVDDVAYEGPETTTVYESSDGIYHFYVYDFTDEGNQNNNRLSSSGALVTVFKGNRVLGVFSVPAGKLGTLWDVCTYDMTTNILTPVNEVYYHPGKSYNVGKTPAEIIRESAFDLMSVQDGGTYCDRAYSYLDDQTMYIRGGNETLNNPKFYYYHDGAETEYTPVDGEAYTGIAKVTFNGETIEFKVYYTQQMQVYITGESLVDTYYRTVYSDYEDEDDEDTEYYYTDIYGEEVPDELTIQFKPSSVTSEYEKVTGKDYIGIIHADNNGVKTDIRVYYSFKTNAFNYVTVADEEIIGQYSRYVSSSGEYINYTYCPYYYTTVYGEKPLTDFDPEITFSKEEVTATYEAVSGKDYIGIIHASYKNMQRDIRVYFTLDTDAFNSVMIEADGLVNVYSRYVDYGYDEFNNYEKYYYTDIYGENEPVNPTITFRKEGVTATYDATPGKGYIGTIHASYGTFSRDIRVVYTFRTYAFDYVSITADDILRNDSVQAETDILDQVLYYYVNIYGENEPADFTIKFNNQDVTFTYDKASGEDYIGIIHASYKDMKRDIRVYYILDTDALDYVNVYANGITSEDEFWVDSDEDDDENVYYYIDIYAVNELQNPVVAFSNPAVSATYEAVSGEDYIGIIHAKYKTFERDILVYLNLKDADDAYSIYSYEFAADGSLSKKTEDYRSGSRQEYYYDAAGNISKDIYTYSDGSSKMHEYEYDQNNKVIKQSYTGTNGKTSVYEYEYDQATGEIIKSTYTNSSGDIEITEYDPATGNTIKEEETYSSGYNYVRTYEYDEITGKVIKESYSNSDGETSVSEYEYDQVTGEKIRSTYTNSSGDIDIIEYDSVTGKILKEEETYGSGYSYVYTYEYDEITGKKVKESYSNSNGDSYTVTFEYDEVTGEPVKEEKTGSEGVIYTTVYEYDASTGKRIKEERTSPDGSGYCYKYDASTGETLEYTYRTSYGYGYTTTYTYDENTGNKTKEETQYLSGENYFTLYDSEGYRMYKEENIPKDNIDYLYISIRPENWSQENVIDTVVTGSAIRFTYEYDHEEDGYGTYLKEEKVYITDNGVESLYFTAAYECEYDEDYYDYRTNRTTWTYADGRKRVWDFTVSPYTETKYDSDGSIIYSKEYNP